MSLLYNECSELHWSEYLFSFPVKTNKVQLQYYQNVSRIFVFMFKKQFIYEYTDSKIFKDICNYIVAHLRCVYTSF